MRAFRPARDVACACCRRAASPSSSRRSHPAGVFEGMLPAQAHARRLPPRGRLPRRHRRSSRARRRTRSLPTLGELDLHLIARGPPRAAVGRARRAPARRSTRRAGTAFAVWAPGGAGGQRRRRLQRLERARAPDALARRRPASGSCSCPRPPRAAPTSSRSAAPTDVVRLKADPLALRAELPPKTGSVVFEPRHALARRRLASTRRRAAEPHAGADVDLRGAPRLVAAQPARGQPLADLRASWPTSSPTTRSTSASRTSS